MHLTSAFSALLFASLASASPKARRSVCVPNQCYTAISSQGSIASEDCSSFLDATVSQCPATTTVLATTTFVQPVSYVIETSVNYIYDEETVTETDYIEVATIEDTVTYIQPTEVDVINIIVTAVTVVVTDEVLKRAPTPVFRRLLAASNCTATTTSASDLPTYASACSNSAAYSSACARFGVTGSTTTLPQSTSTSTSVLTVTTQPVSTTVVIDEEFTTIYDTVEVAVPTTFETTDGTVIVQSGFTLTSNIIIPTTVVVYE